MRTRPARLLAALLLALGVAAGAHAQGAPEDAAAVLPVWSQDRLEGFLLLEPADAAQAGTRWRFGRSALEAAFGVKGGDSLGLLCERRGSLGALASLSQHCMVAALGDGAGRRTSAGASLFRNGGRVGVQVGETKGNLPAWITPRAARVEQTDLTVFAQKNIGSEGMVSIGGTLARARLVSAGEAPALADQWNTRSLTVGGRVGAFGADIVGRVVDVPGQPEQWEGYGVGLTWRTPWSGKLTVGADNLVTRGRNPFAPSRSSEDDGAVPYVRYEQEL
jgi:hypothetical protein